MNVAVVISIVVFSPAVLTHNKIGFLMNEHDVFLLGASNIIQMGKEVINSLEL